MGDIIHTLPALTDAMRVIPDLKFDWMVESAFAEIPKWHPAVQEVIPISLREWKQYWYTKRFRHEFHNFLQKLRAKQYNMVIDAQGLLKSALLARLAQSELYKGYAATSAKEGFASIFYDHKIAIGKELHAITRIRKLWAEALNYSIINTEPLDYGVDWHNFTSKQSIKPYLFFLHGTTWEAKHWPEPYWQQLADLAMQGGYAVYMTSATSEQKARVERLASRAVNITILPKLSITEALQYLKGAAGVVTVDTGFGHLASALGVPVVALYGPTDPKLVGAVGKKQINLTSTLPCVPCSKRRCYLVSGHKIKANQLHHIACNNKIDELLHPYCLAEITPDQVWQQVVLLLDEK